MKYHEIQGWFNFQDLYARIVSMAPFGATLVELGCWRGKSTVFMDAIIRGMRRCDLKFYACDPFESGGYGDAEATSAGGADIAAEFYENLASNNANLVTFWRGSDLEFGAQFPKGSCYFVFIDSLHTYKHVCAVIERWWPCMKPGGWLCGHDLQVPDVAAAVRDMAVKLSFKYHLDGPSGSFIIPVPERCTIGATDVL